MDCSFNYWCIALTLLPLSILCELICPTDVTEISFPAQLTCIVNAKATVIDYVAPGGKTVATCDTNNACTDRGIKGYNASRLNTTHSWLTIQEARVGDKGNWICVNVFAKEKSNCSLILTARPSCNIESYSDTDNLHIGEELTLSVYIRDYYCSGPIDFLLQTGDTVVTVNNNLTTDSLTTDNFSSIFNVSEQNYGSLELMFICHNVHKTIQCDGVQRLKAELPSCNISSDQDTETITVGDQVFLTIYIEQHFCLRNIKYQLQVGAITQTLIKNMSQNEIVLLNYSFSATDSHYGSVGLFLICNSINRTVLCKGVRTLKKSTSTAQEVGDNGTNLIPIIAGTIAAVAFTAAVIILIWYGVMVHQRKTNISAFQRECPYADVADNVNSRPKSIRFKDNGAYAEIEVSEVGSTSIKESDERGTAPAHITPDMERDDTTGISSAHISPEVGYASADEYKNDGPPAYSIGLSEKSPNFKPEDVYSKVNKRISKTSVSGDC